MILNCWICGSEANSKEHKFKSSDLKRSFGKQFSQSVILRLGDEDKKLQGPNSSLVKHEAPICQKCNNDLTSPHDKAYDKLISGTINNFEINRSRQFIDTREFYGDNWQMEIRNLYKYFAKQIGSRIVDAANSQYPISLKKFILNDIEIQSIKLRFQIKVGMEILNAYNKFETGDGISHLFNGATIPYCSLNGSLFFHGWSSYSWLTVHWIYSEHDLQQPIKQLNNPIIPVHVQEFDFQGRNEGDDLYDWFEHYGISNDNDRLNFMQSIIEE